MTHFLRQLAALGVMVALTQLLMPEGKLKEAASFATSLLVSLLLMTTVTGWLSEWGVPAAVTPDTIFAQAAQSQDELMQAYQEKAVMAQANQTALLARRVLTGEGYACETTAYYDQSGALDHIAVHSSGAIEQRELKMLTQRLCQALNVTPDKIMFVMDGSL